jgi:anti-sigma factor RsiW
MSDTYHPAEDRLEAFVEGSLDRAERVVIESHLLGCARCQVQVEEWRALFAALSGLPQLAPSAGFADRVMAGVRVAPERGRRTAWDQAWQRATRQASGVAAAAGRLLPKTTAGWAMATGLLAIPVAASAMLLVWLGSNASLDPATLWAFVSAEARDWLAAAGTAAVTTVLQTDVAAWVVDRGGSLLETAGTTGIGALLAAACGTTVLSVWVLYRYLFRTPARETHHVTYSF